MNKSVIFSIIVLIVLAVGAVFAVRLMRPTPEETAPIDNGEVAQNGGCYVGGCSGQICSDKKDDAITTCEYKEEYACYKSAKCERQLSGQCGWTETLEFSSCMNAILYPGSDLK